MGSTTHKREQEVLDAARELFWEHGYAGTTIADVADRLGVLKGSLYYYVDSKEDLLMRVIQEAHDDALVILEEIAALDLPALERLHAFAERYVRWTLDHLEAVGVYFRDWSNLTGERRATVRRQRKVFEQFIRDLVGDAQREGSAPADQDPQTTMFFLLGAINSVWTWYQPKGALDAADVAARYAASAVATAIGTDYTRTPADASSRRA